MSSARLAPIGGWVLGLGLCAWLVLGHTPVVSDLTMFMPRGGTAGERLLVEELGKSPASRQILMAIGGDSAEARAQASRELARRLQASGRFVWVENGGRRSRRADFERLFKYRYLLSPAAGPETFSAAGLERALRRRLTRLGSPLAPLEKRLLPADPTGAFSSLLLSRGSFRQPERHLGVWFSSGHAHALLLGETRSAGLDLDAQQETLQAVEGAFRNIRGTRELRLITGGPGMYAVRSRETIRSEVRIFGTLAAGAVVLILLAFYRSVPLLLLSSVPLLSAVFTGAAAVSLLFGGIHGITLTFGITLLGVVIDYPLHVFSQLAPGQNYGGAFQRIRPTLRLSAVTTCIGYLALTATSFTGLMQIGVFAVAGILAALLATHWIIPAFLPASWAGRYDAGAAGWLNPHLLSGRPAALAVTVAGLAGLLAALLASGSPWEDDLAALSPIPERVIAQDRVMRAEIGAPEVNHLALISAPDVETALQQSEALALELQGLLRQGAIGGFDMAALHLPSARTQIRRREQLPAPEALRKNLARARSQLPFAKDVFLPFLRDVEAARHLEPLRLADLEGTAPGARISSMLVRRDDGGFSALVPLSGVRDPQALPGWFQARGLEGLHYVNVKSQAYGLVSRFRGEAATLVLWGVLAMACVLWLGLRSLRAVAAVLYPVALAIVIELALLLGLGSRLSLFHLVSLLLVLGIGIDYSLFFSRRGLTLAARKRTLHALLACCISTVVMFGLLALSSIPVLKAIGGTAALGVGISFLMAMVFAPRAEAAAAAE